MAFACLIVRMVFWTMVVGTRFKLGRRGARVGRERRGGLSRDLTTFLVCTPLLSRLHPRSFDPIVRGDEGGRRWGVVKA